jgi:hypothetical protein
MKKCYRRGMGRGTASAGACALVWALLAGCGGSTSMGGSGGVALRDLPRQVAELQCRKLFDCCTPAQIATAGSSIIVSFTDEASCRTAYENLLEPSTPRREAAINEGRVIYDGREASACLARIEFMTCEELTSGSVPTCDAPWTPLQQDGEVCESDSECVSEFCEFGIGPTSQKTCTPAARLGEPCTGNCADGAFCDFDTSICAPVKRLGESCSTSSECGSTLCDFNAGVCVPDSICPP